MKALLVKEDGLIYAAEVPEEKPIMDMSGAEAYPQMVYEAEVEEYETTLASAKESAVLVSDQEKARELIIRKGSISRDKDGFYQPIVGVHPIPDLDWTTVDVKIARILSTDGKHKQMPLTGQIAILKESTPSTEQESQEEIWAKVIFDARHYNGTPHDLTALTDHLKKQFTITRRKP